MVNLGLIQGLVQVPASCDQVILVSKKAITINLPIINIPTLSRNTKGVILMRFKSSDDKVNAMTIIDKSPEFESEKASV